MPTDPSDPSSPKPSTRLYQTAPDAPKGGGGGIFLILLLLLALGGGAAYYFLLYKPSAAAPLAAATPKPTPASSAPPKSNTDAVGNPTYSKAQRQEYIQTAIDNFKALRQSRVQPFTDAFSALMTAGGFSAASLPTKDAIAARHEMVKKCLAANDDYIAFIKDQEKAYTAELKKTALVANDVEVESSYTGAKMPTDKIVQLRTLQGESLKTGDQMLTYLETTFGTWSVNADKHLVFKKTSDGGPFGALAKSYSEQVAALNKLRDEVNADAAVDPTASSPSPTGSPAASSPSPAGTPSVAPAASAKP